MSAVWPLPIPLAEKMVLLAIADNANDEGYCWPSVKTLQKKSSMSRSSVQNCINKLIIKGYLKRELRFNSSSNFRIEIPPPTTKAPCDTPRPDKRLPPPTSATPPALHVGTEPSTNHQFNHQQFLSKLKKEGVTKDKLKIFEKTSLSLDGCTLFAPTEFARARIEGFYITPLHNIGIKNVQVMQ